MIRPRKYMNTQQCVLRVAGIALKHVRESLAVSLADLRGSIQTRLGDGATVNFQAAIGLLFLLGVVDYDDTTDTVVYVAPDDRARL